MNLIDREKLLELYSDKNETIAKDTKVSVREIQQNIKGMPTVQAIPYAVDDKPVYHNTLVNLASCILRINQDVKSRLRNPKTTSVNDFEVRVFEQVWGSTALGFSGMGGQAMTTAYTIVLIPSYCDDNCFVYFDGEFAYSVPYNEAVRQDIQNGRMKSVSQKGYYLK